MNRISSRDREGALMPYKDLLVYLDDSKSCARRVDAAIRLAAQHGAHLAGVYPICEIPLLNYIREQIPPDIRASMDAEAKALAEAALKDFREAAERGGVSYEARTDHALDTTLTDVVSMHARYADLVVLGQANPDGRPYVDRHLPEEVVLSSGRPALIIPYDWSLEMLGERVVIAWDASREAARAVGDAMPILEQAQSVLVVSINPRSTPFGHGEVPGADIGGHLARHKVKAEVQSVETDGMEIGDAILSFACDRGCDLLVMGAYARSRVRQLILGGATRTILKSMTLPVLTAH
jgi:nucleotide-binding universal stress UspA family protein